MRPIARSLCTFVTQTAYAVSVLHRSRVRLSACLRCSGRGSSKAVQRRAMRIVSCV